MSCEVFGGRFDRQSLIALAEADNSFCWSLGLNDGICHISLL